MATSTLPISPIASASTGPAAQAGVVQISLAATSNQIVTGAEFGLATTMGNGNHDYTPYGDPAFQAVANKYPTDLLRHNWELNTLMDIMYPSRGSASTPNFSAIDTYLNQQSSLKSFFNNQTGTQIVTLGFPSWLNISNSSDQALYAGMVKQIAQHFIDKGEPVHNYELINEPDGHESVTDMANTFNVVAQALKSVDPTYKLGGLTESYARPDDLKTFFQIAGQNIGFVSWHQYVTNGSDGKSDQQIVTDSMNGVANDAQTVRALMRTAGISDSVPLFLGEYNVNGAVYTSPNNQNMVGAVSAAATTYGMVHSNTNLTMGALWDVMNDSAYSVFGAQGSYHANPVGVVLADLTAYMPGNLVQTIMPSNTPGLVGYTTVNGQGFSTALIDTNLSQGYTVDLSKNGLPTTGLYRLEVSNANPQGTKTALTDLSHVSIAAGSLVIITNEAPHGGTEFTGTSTSAPAPTPTPTPTPTPAPTPTPTPMPPAAPASSAITPGVGTFSDAAGNTYKIDAAGNAYENNALMADSANTKAMQYTGGQIYGQDATSQSWYTWNQASWTAAAAPPAPTPVPLPMPLPVPARPGADTLQLRLSEDAWQGDAQAVITVDGKPAGGTVTVTAPHSQGQTQLVTLAGAWGPGPHDVGVQFINDAYGGSGATDRNLYVNGLSLNGQDAAAAPAALYSNGTAHLATAASPLVLQLSEDAYQGDAQFTVAVDGKTLGGAQSVTALHASGAAQNFAFGQAMAAGTHDVAVSFLNDAWGGSAATDRNLYVNAVTLNGAALPGTAATLLSTATQHFAVVVAAHL
jgi:hypothetical protein